MLSHTSPPKKGIGDFLDVVCLFVLFCFVFSRLFEMSISRKMQQHEFRSCLLSQLDYKIRCCLKADWYIRRMQRSINLRLTLWANLIVRSIEDQEVKFNATLTNQLYLMMLLLAEYLSFEWWHSRVCSKTFKQTGTATAIQYELLERDTKYTLHVQFWNLGVLFFFEIPQHSAGTADLLEQMENFSGNLARNLPYLKRDSNRYRRSTESILPPYTVITPNIGEENKCLCFDEF